MQANKKDNDDKIHINVAICDDDAESLEEISKTYLDVTAEVSLVSEITTFRDGQSLLRALENGGLYDILFLDIEMPELTGFQIANRLKQIRSQFDMILFFVSANSHYVFDSFDYQPLRFIRKNTLQTDMKKAMDIAYNRIYSRKGKHVVWKTAEGDFKIEYGDVLYFELYRRRLTLYRKEDSISLVGRMTMRQLRNELDPDVFLTINSGCIVNLGHVSRTSAMDIVMDNGVTLAVSRSRGKEVKVAVARYWREKI